MSMHRATRSLLLGLALLAGWGARTGLAAGAFGPQRTAVFLLDYAQDTPETLAGFFPGFFFDGPNSFAAFVRETSFGQADLVGEVFGWYGFPADQLVEGIWPDLDRVFAAARADIPDFRVYDKFIFVMADVEAAAYGVSSFGPILIHTPDGDVAATRCTIWRNFFQSPHDMETYTPNSTVAHELIHSFGVEGHANALDCGASFVDARIVPGRQLSGADPFDIMGGRWWGSHPSAAFKRKIGWLAENQEITARESGTHTIYPVETAGPEPRLLTVPLAVNIPVNEGAQISRYGIEYRVPGGFDTGLQDLEEFDFSPLPGVDTGGLLIRGVQEKEDGSVSHTYLLDATPESRPAEFGYAGDFIDAFLAPGCSVFDAVNGIRISCGAARADGGIEVGVRYLPDLEIARAVITPVPGRTSSRAQLTIRNRYPWNRPVLPPGQRYIYVACEGLVRDPATGAYRRPRVKPSWNTVMAVTGVPLNDLITRGEATVNVYVTNPVNGNFNAMVFMVDPQSGDYHGNAGWVEESDDTNNRIVVNL